MKYNEYLISNWEDRAQTKDEEETEASAIDLDDI